MLITPKRLKLRTSNFTRIFPGTVRHDPLKFFEKEAWSGSRDPLNFGGLNANSSKMVKATDFKIDVHVSTDSPDITPLKCFEKGAWPGSRDPLNFWALNGKWLKWLKLQSSDLTYMFPGTVWT